MKQPTMNEYDCRQYTLMHDVIMGAQPDFVSVRRVLDTLMSLFSMLQDADEQWLALLWEQWWVIEEVYAVALYRNEAHFQKEDASLVESTLKSIDKSILDKLSL